MLYFFHHYELPVILQQAQIQQLLMRSHHGVGGVLGLAGIAALASGGAYHNAPPAPATSTQSNSATTSNISEITASASTASQSQPDFPEEAQVDNSLSVERQAEDNERRQDVRIEEINTRKPSNDLNTVSRRCNDLNNFEGKVNNLHMDEESKQGSSGCSSVAAATLDRRRSESVDIDDDPPLIAVSDDTLRQRRAPLTTPEADHID